MKPSGSGQPERLDAVPDRYITSSTHQAEAEAFVAYVLSPAGEQVLTAAGFQQP